MKSGIYKIVNPTGKIYVGQSIDIEHRWRQYRHSLSHTKGQPALYRSFLKYGTESHIFEIVETCEVPLLNERERHWQDHYDVLNSEGLNCVLQSTTEKRRVLSEEMKRKMSESSRRAQANPEVRKKKSEITKKAYKDNPERRKQMGERVRGCKWYNNGVEEIHTREPQEGFKLGRLVKPPTGSGHPNYRPLAKLDPYTLEVLRTYDVVREVEQDEYKISGVVTALYKGILYKGFKWCFLDKIEGVRNIGGGSKHYNNGIENRFTKEHPGEGFTLGRL